jgi:hypothetical protein
MNLSRIEKVQTPAIASNAATIQSDTLIGYVDTIKLEVRVAAGTASSNTCTVTITDSVTGRTLLTATGITGVSNEYPLQIQAKGVTGAAITGIYQRFFLANQRLTLAVTSGTDTEYVIGYIIMAES